MTAYFALIHKDPDSDYGVSFPDLPGCISVGSNLDEARVMGGEALALHIEGLRADGATLPQPSSLEVVAASEEAAEAVAIIRIEAANVTLEATA